MKKKPNIIPYKKKGKIFYKFQAYLGVDPLTGKKVKTTRQGFKSIAEATKEYNRIVKEFEIGERKVNKKETFKEIYDIWIDIYKTQVEPSTFLKTKQMFKNHILPFFGHFKIDKINTLQCQTFIIELSDKLINVSQYKSYTSNIFEQAIILKIINDNPMKPVKVPKNKKVNATSKKAENFYTSEELTAFLDSLDSEEDLKKVAFFYLLSFTGMRKGEVFALSWDDIDFQTKLILVDKAIARGEHGLYYGPPKNKLPRIITFDSALEKILLKWKDTQKKLSNSDVQLIFPNTKEEATDPNTSTKWITSIQKKYNLKRITTHGLRHTHCSLLLEAGCSLKEVQDRLGHQDINTTMRVYAHISQKQRNSVPEKFSKFLNKKNSP